MDTLLDASQQTVHLARQVLAIAEAKPHRESDRHRELLRAIHKLQVTAESPAQYIIRERHEPLELMCILMALESGVLQAIVDRRGVSVTAAELTEKTGTDTLLIVRFMRLLTAVNICDEAGAETYVANDVAEYLTARGQQAGMEIVAEVLFPIGSTLLTHMRAGCFHQFSDRTHRDERTLFETTLQMSFWEYFRARPRSGGIHDQYMASRRDGLRPDWSEIYPVVEELGTKAIEDEGGEKIPMLVDVGGNHGYDLAKFRSQYPHIAGRCILQDLPETLAGMSGPLEAIDVMAYDFFTPQPVKGARVYLFKSVCHDFTDQECRQFLGNTVAAMSQHSSLLIDDRVLPEAGAPMLGASEDIMMMMLLAGMERSLGQWRRLLSSLGLFIKEIWPSRGGRESVIEAKRVSVSD